MHAARLSNVAVLEPPRRLRPCSHRPHLQTARVRHITIFWKLPSYQDKVNDKIWAAPSEFVTYRLCEQRRFRRACASAQSRQNLRCSLIQAVNQEEPSDRKPDPWPLWMAGHARLKFVMTECSKTQIRLAGLKYAAVIQCGSLCILRTPLLLHSQAPNGGCFYFQSFFNVCISTEYPVPLCYEDGETKIEELPYCSGKSAGLAIQGSLVRSSALQSFGWDYKLRSRLRHDIVVSGTLNSKHHHHHHLNTIIDIHLTFEGW